VEGSRRKKKKISKKNLEIKNFAKKGEKNHYKPEGPEGIIQWQQKRSGRV